MTLRRLAGLGTSWLAMVTGAGATERGLQGEAIEDPHPPQGHTACPLLTALNLKFTALEGELRDTQVAQGDAVTRCGTDRGNTQTGNTHRYSRHR